MYDSKTRCVDTVTVSSVVALNRYPSKKLGREMLWCGIRHILSSTDDDTQQLMKYYSLAGIQ